MRCLNIPFKAKLPVPVNSEGNEIYQTDCFCDANDNIYEINAIRSACSETKNIPITRFDKDGKQTVIGIVTKMSYQDGFINVEGTMFGGGTNEEIIFSDKDHKGNIVSMDIESIGIGD